MEFNIEANTLTVTREEAQTALLAQRNQWAANEGAEYLNDVFNYGFTGFDARTNEDLAQILIESDASSYFPEASRPDDFDVETFEASNGKIEVIGEVPESEKQQILRESAREHAPELVAALTALGDVGNDRAIVREIAQKALARLAVPEIVVAPLGQIEDEREVNKGRAMRAGLAIKFYETNFSDDGDDKETIASDLLTNIMHWCDQHGLEFSDMSNRARENHTAETLCETESF
jgi:hypothetical protein